MKNEWVYYWIKHLLRNMFSVKMNGSIYGGREFLEGVEANEYISEKIKSGLPFMTCRIGANESFSMRTFYFSHNKNMQKAIDQLCDCAGFFPKEINYGFPFVELMQDSLKNADLCGVLKCPFDDFFLKHFTNKECKSMMLYSVDPIVYTKPWSLALEGKRVLVVHPFEESIQSQYKNRKRIFGNKAVLPEFELITLKAVQTSGGEKDDRFETWFDALEFMKGKIREIEFDVALLGCGAYGLPLAAYIKNMEKQAIHIGGGLQILFGIKGKRWDNNEVINQYYNEFWVYPNENERPGKADMIENGCYWG